MRLVQLRHKTGLIWARNRYVATPKWRSMGAHCIVVRGTLGSNPESRRGVGVRVELAHLKKTKKQTLAITSTYAHLQ